MEIKIKAEAEVETNLRKDKNLMIEIQAKRMLS